MMIARKPLIPDFYDVSSFDDISRRFHDAAEQIMLGHDLVYENPDETQCMQITNLELYLHCGFWTDPNTDADCKQLTSGRWYVHRNGRNANTSRVDITAGRSSEEQQIYAGLLVRGIDGVDGSGKAIKRLIRGKSGPSRWDWTDEEIEILDRINGSSVTSGSLRLTLRGTPRTGKVSFRERIGLEHPEEPWNAALHAFVAYHV